MMGAKPIIPAYFHATETALGCTPAQGRSRMRGREFIAGIGTTSLSPLLAFGLISILAAQAVGITPAAAQGLATFHTFRCDDSTDFVVTFYRGENRALVKLDGKTTTLPRRLSLSGKRYSSGGITLRIKENGATLSRGRKATECSSS
jgi:membrane-bound inhibitor of C-type lysozyme